MVDDSLSRKLKLSLTKFFHWRNLRYYILFIILKSYVTILQIEIILIKNFLKIFRIILKELSYKFYNFLEDFSDFFLYFTL